MADLLFLLFAAMVIAVVGSLALLFVHRDESEETQRQREIAWAIVYIVGPFVLIAAVFLAVLQSLSGIKG